MTEKKSAKPMHDKEIVGLLRRAN